MNKKGFTLVELLATLVILGIVVGITIVSVTSSFRNAKDKTEDVFVNTLEDALDMYLDSDANRLKFSNNEFCTISKKSGDVRVYKSTDYISFKNIITSRNDATNDEEKRINSSYSPLAEQDLVNPANEEVACNSNVSVEIYRDDDYVYYYKVSKDDFGCLKNGGYITNLPSECY